MTTVTIPEGMPQYGDAPRFDVDRVRADFPILGREVYGEKLVYLDSANTSQKPQQVIEAMAVHYAYHNANVARSVHALGTEATEAYEGARVKVAQFINAPSANEIVFTKNATEAINLVANSFSTKLKPGDEIVISEMEHHSNIVPWQLLTQRTGATLRWFGVTEEGRLDLSNIDELINERTKVVALVHVSNALGTINPVKQMIEMAHRQRVPVLLDGAQAVAHLPVDVQELDCDFYVFSGHKVLGPTGIGILYGKADFLEGMPPYQGGGDMIESVSTDRITYGKAPHKFEAGTPPIAQAVGLGAAVDYLTGLDMRAVQQHEKELTGYALEALDTVPGLRIFGPRVPVGRGGILSFALEGIHPHDIGQVLDAEGIEVRVGHHCARPTCLRFGVPATTRASLYVHTTTEEVDALVRGLDKVRKVFR
ncbi:MAG TPA: cysteine desulfurase [Micromonosporaceae bacterium]|nr:cysteine desulfurase [Micromonosporaceae bacterium]